jgi:3-hydroxyisobutyrate dehydrogenase-like beta-hydroxyacid dehydrogenase
VVLLALADDTAVEEVVLGPGGLISSLGDAALVDTSTVSPATSRFSPPPSPGGRMVAAPILGAPAAVLAGMAT